jgi:hypothetical protein
MQRGFDIGGLRRFIAACKQNYDLAATLCKINSITGP